MARRTRLPAEPPWDWEALLGFLEPRSIPGVERIDDGVYRRTLCVGGRDGVVEVRRARRGDGVELSARLGGEGRRPPRIVERFRAVFDLDAPVGLILRHLRRDPVLRRRLRGRSSVRVPGAWDPFELTVRAVLGQQVTVRGATTLAGRLVHRFGRRLRPARDGLDRVFPTADALANAEVESIGLPGARARTLRALAQAVRRDEDFFDRAHDVHERMERLRALPGIGDWTAQYVAMRALRAPDAFPAGDLGLRKALGPPGHPLSERELTRRAERWRPWRAYAAMAIWQSGR